MKANNAASLRTLAKGWRQTPYKAHMLSVIPFQLLRGHKL